MYVHAYVLYIAHVYKCLSSTYVRTCIHTYSSIRTYVCRYVRMYVLKICSALHTLHKYVYCMCIVSYGYEHTEIQCQLAKCLPSTAIEVLIGQNYTVTKGGVVDIVVEVNSTDYEFNCTVTLNHMDGSAGGE